MINYLDRSNISITAPAMRAELGSRHGADGLRALRVRVDVRALSDSRRLAGGPRRAARAVRDAHRALVHRDHHARLHLHGDGPDRGAPARRRARVAVVSDQQSRRDDLVSGARARDGDRLLHVGTVRRPRVPDSRARPDPDAGRLAHGVRRHGQRRRAVGAGLVPPLPAAARLSRHERRRDRPDPARRRAGRSRDAIPRRRAAASPAPTWPTCSRSRKLWGVYIGQFAAHLDALVLPHLVPDVSRFRRAG